MGVCPRNVAPPVLSKAKRLVILNSPDISVQFCTHSAGEYIVEEVDDYKVVVKKPDTRGVKSKLVGCEHQEDFTIWVFEPSGCYWMPKHLETLKAFHGLVSPAKQSLFKAIKDVILNFQEPKVSWTAHKCQNIQLCGYPTLLVLSYLKWMAVLEDTRYPPAKYLGRKMPFAGYVLVYSGLYSPNEIRRLLKIWSSKENTET